MDNHGTNSIANNSGEGGDAAGGSVQSDPLPSTLPNRGGTAEAETIRKVSCSRQVDPSSAVNHDPLLDRSFDVPPRFHRRRRPHQIATTTNSTDDRSHQRHYQETSIAEEPYPSFTQSALNGTFGLLRHVGGVTLSTTGALVAPPLNVTRRVLLPQLRAILVDLWESNSPQRLKDWFRIVQSSIYHIVYTLRDTSAGHNLRNQWLLVWQDLIDIASTDLTRQWLIDAMGTIIKASEALDTEEASAFFDQAAITITRALEILSNPRCRLLVHDWRHAVASLVTLLADPVATTALAEVTAYLCYALEKEHLPHLENQKRRHFYQTAINQRDTIDKHPTMTVEEAILSSLDSVPIMNHEFSREEQEELPWDTASSIRDQVEKDAIDSSLDWCEKARSNVDVQYLREMIEERGMEKQSKKAMQQDIATDNHGSNATSAQGRRVEVETVSEDDARGHNLVTFTTDEDPPARPGNSSKVRLDGESPIDQFERILNEILKEQRLSTPVPRHGTDKVASKPSPSRTKAAKPRGGGKLLVFLGVMVVLGIGTLWFGFGCFGLYLYWKHSQPHSMVSSSVANHEIVVRVVREVVHVDTHGKVLGRGLLKSPQSEISVQEYEKVAACVAEAYNV